MYRLRVCNHNEFKPPKGVKPERHHNHMPKPFVRCEADVYYYARKLEVPSFIEHRHITEDGIGGVVIEWFHACGFAIRFPNKWRSGPKGGPPIIYDEPVQYFRIGCDHEYQELSQRTCRERNLFHGGRCYHVNECTKCGHIWSYDSSD